MAKITLNLDERSMKNEKAQVRIRISHKKTNCFISTGVYVEPRYFQPDTIHDAVHRKAPMAAQLRMQISEQVQRIEDWLADVDREELTKMTANDIRDRSGYSKKKNTTNKRTARIPIIRASCVPNTETDFVKWFGEYGDSRQTAKTRESYTYGWNVLREYCKSLGVWTLSFDQIDYTRLSDFGCWLTSTGRGPSTRHMLESYVRAAYKEAMKRHMVRRESDPYYDYSIKPIPPRDIEVLTPSEMHALMTAEFTQKGMQRARDLAMTSFYLCGANLLDIYEMPKAKASKVEFVRHKIENRYQKKIQIRIEPELAALIECYKGDDHLLYFKSTYANYESFRHKISHSLEDVSAELGFDVTMAKIRRTWATIAAELDVPDSVINRSMGHVDNSLNGRHYVDYKWIKTAEANRKVIDYVLSA